MPEFMLAITVTIGVIGGVLICGALVAMSKDYTDR